MDAYLDGMLDELVAAEPREAWSDVLGRARRSRLPSISRRWAVGGLIAATVLSAGGLATARATGLLDFGPLHQATLDVSPTTLVGTSGQISTCELIGKRADQVEATLAASGIGIEWRFQHWGTVVETTGDSSPAAAAQAGAQTVADAEAVSGGSSDAVSSVPDDSIVWDAVPDDQSPNMAFVFVEAPNDPNAPTVSPTGCP